MGGRAVARRPAVDGERRVLAWEDLLRLVRGEAHPDVVRERRAVRPRATTDDHDPGRGRHPGGALAVPSRRASPRAPVPVPRLAGAVLRTADARTGPAAVARLRRPVPSTVRVRGASGRVVPRRVRRGHARADRAGPAPTVPSPARTTRGDHGAGGRRCGALPRPRLHRTHGVGLEGGEWIGEQAVADERDGADVAALVDIARARGRVGSTPACGTTGARSTRSVRCPCT